MRLEIKLINVIKAETGLMDFVCWHILYVHVKCILPIYIRLYKHLAYTIQAYTFVSCMLQASYSATLGGMQLTETVSGNAVQFDGQSRQAELFRFEIVHRCLW